MPFRTPLNGLDRVRREIRRNHFVIVLNLQNLLRFFFDNNGKWRPRRYLVLFKDGMGDELLHKDRLRKLLGGSRGTG